MVNSSSNFSHKKKANKKAAIIHYFVIDVFTGERKTFYATNDNDAFAYACEHYEKGLRIYANIGGGIFLGETR